jgi:hypothetical protein
MGLVVPPRSRTKAWEAAGLKLLGRPWFARRLAGLWRAGWGFAGGNGLFRIHHIHIGIVQSAKNYHIFVLMQVKSDDLELF